MGEGERHIERSHFSFNRCYRRKWAAATASAGDLVKSCPELILPSIPLEGTNLCAVGAKKMALAVLAAAERGGL